MFLQIGIDTISVAKNNISNNIFYHWSWFYIAIAELLIIIFLVLILRKKDNNLVFSELSNEDKKNAQGQAIDMNNLMNSINGSRDLYKELSRKCHPDRFVNSPLQKIAEEIFQEISKSKRDYEKLLLLKLKAENELNIKF